MKVAPNHCSNIIAVNKRYKKCLPKVVYEFLVT